MAFVENEDEKNKQQQAGGQTPQVAPPTTSSAPGAGPAQAGKNAPQATPAQPFQNIQAYLTANQPQVQQRAGEIAGNLTNQYGQLKGAVDTAKTGFENDITKGYAQPNEDLISRAASNPSEFIKNPNDVSAFQSLYNDTYRGPQNFESSTAYGDLTGKINKATTDANLATTLPGLQSYFQSQNPNATKGGSILDSVLLQGSPEAYGKIKTAADQYKDLPDYLKSAVTSENQRIQDAMDIAAKTGPETQNRFVGPGGVIQSFQTDINQRLSNEQQAARDEAANVSALLGRLGLLSSDEARYAGIGLKDQQNGAIAPIDQDSLALVSKDLGMTPENLQRFLYAKSLSPGLDFNKFIGENTNPEEAINMERFATPGDYDRAAALEALTGQPSFLKGNRDLSGQYSRDLINFNESGAMNEAGQTISDYLNKLKYTPPVIPPPVVVPPGTPPPVMPVIQTPTETNTSGQTEEQAFVAYKAAHPEMSDLDVLKNFYAQWTPQAGTTSPTMTTS